MQGSQPRRTDTDRVLVIEDEYGVEAVKEWAKQVRAFNIELDPLIFALTSQPHHVMPNRLDQVLERVLPRLVSQEYAAVTIDLNLGVHQRSNFVGLDILSAIKQQNDRQKCIVITSYPSLRNFHNAIMAGAEGFVDKTRLPASLVLPIGAILREVIDGRRYYDGTSVAYIAEYVNESKLPYLDGDRRDQEWPLFTSQESRVLGFLKKGLTNAEIGKQMGGISENTVGVYLRQIYGKLGLDGTKNELKRAEAVRIADERGLAE